MSHELRLVTCFRQVFPTLADSDIRAASMKRLGAWNSAALLTLLVRVEKEFNVRFEMDQINTFTSFDAILSALDATARRGAPRNGS